jgi:uncharacterized protein (TIGR03435 family)
MASPNRVQLKNWTLLDLIAAAYSVRATEVSGPAWLSDEAFDIEAEVPDGTPKEQLNPMLQSLLEDRFGLSAHRETKTEEGFALIIGRNGPSLKAAMSSTAPVEAPSETEQTVQLERQLHDMMGKNADPAVIEAGPYQSESWPSITTNQLAAALVRFVGVPVVDETGLAGQYAVSIRVSSNPKIPGGTVFDAVEKLGLKLDRRKVAIETVVVEHVSKVPSPN